MGLLLTAAAASRIEKSGNDLADICRMLSSDRRFRNGSPAGADFLPAEPLPKKCLALPQAKYLLARNKAIRSMDILVRSGDDSVDLLRVGKRGGWKRITRIWGKDGQPC